MPLRITMAVLAALCANVFSSPAQAQVVVTTQPSVRYTMAPVPEEYVPYRSTNTYSSRDLDQDGVIETATVVRQPAVTAIPTGSLDRVTFVGPGDPAVIPVVPRALIEAERKSATGTINRINIVKARGVDTLLVRVNTSVNGPGTLVDLGPVERWPSGTIRLRDVISASGPVGSVGDGSVVLADRAALNTNPEFAIPRL